MRYCGSKRKFMKYLRPILTKDMNENTVFVDLFCLCEDALVFTKNGVKSIKEVEIGEEIVDEHSKFVTITNKINSGIKDCLKIKVKGGIEFTCSKEHPFYINGEEIKAKDLKVGYQFDCGTDDTVKDTIIDLSKYINISSNKRYGRNGNFDEVKVKLTHISPWIKRYLTIDKDIAKMYGLVVSEGCADSITMNIKEDSFLKQLLELYEEKILDNTTKNKCFYINKKKNTISLMLPNKKIYEKIFFEALQIKHRACNKTISFLFNLKPEIVKEAIKYMFIGDGSVTETNVKEHKYRVLSYKTCSKNIAYELQALLKIKFNINSCVYKGINKERIIEGRKLKPSTYYTVKIYNNEDINVFFDNKQKLVQSQRKCYKILSIEECKKECYDITINNNSHRFIINGGILTHNCGGGNVVCDIPCDNKVAVDYNKYVIALWKELQRNGMKNIPTEVSEEMYNDVKNCYLNKTFKYKDFIIGYVGTCCSFGGSWFNGYARFNPNKNEDHIKEAYNGLKKQVETFKGLDDTVFIYSSYEEVPMNGNEIVYCDPPYASTKRYISDFNNEAFWEWAREASKKVKKLYISEYDAPDDFECIWHMEKKDSLGRKKGKKQNTKVEKLFVYKGRK